MDQHPHDLLPGYALGALDAAETSQVSVHLQSCPGCRDEVEVFLSTVRLLPYTTQLHEPAPHVKQQLFARIAITQSTAQPVAAASARPARTWWARWSGGVAAAALVLALAFGGTTWNMYRQLQAARLQAAATPPNHDAQIMAFMVSPSTVSHSLASNGTKTTGKMFMQPGATTVVLMVDGLQTQPGQTYRCWVAKASQNTAVCTFMTNADGSAVVMFNTPEPISNYQHVMVTLDGQNATPNQPGDNVVLQTSIT